MPLSVITILLQSAYVLCVVGLSLYGANALWLTIIQWRKPQKHDFNGSPAWGANPAPAFDHSLSTGSLSSESMSSGTLSDPTLPTVTVQLPIYNEEHVAVRLLRACARLRYPRAKLQIQILDDSDDHTRTIIQREAKNLRQRGLQIDIVYRSSRAGYKAGALQNGLATAKGEFIAIFDADFEPKEDFLAHTLPHFFKSDNHRLGFIQTRWDHLNADYSALTQSQALALDGHFLIEQPARRVAGYFFGFNGSGGIWRRACIEDAEVGGWQIDTLCEDLDLSYRAQLNGWRGDFLPHVTSPAEIPPQLLAFKRQQFRWAKGSIQTLRKLAPRIVHARLPLTTKLQALMHLGSYWVHPLLLLLLLITLPLELLPDDPIVPLPWLSLTSLGPPILYAAAQHKLHQRQWWRRWRYIPLLTLLGTGLSLNNSIAVFQGFFHSGGEFLRTPKFRIEQPSDQWRQSLYRLRVQPIMIAEFGLMLYALTICGLLIQRQNWWSLPFLLLYAGGFGLMAGMGLWQSLPTRRRSTAETRRAETRHTATQGAGTHTPHASRTAAPRNHPISASAPANRGRRMESNPTYKKHRAHV